MPNALERMRKNKNTRPTDEVDELLNLETDNISINETDNTFVNENENKSENIAAYITANKKPKFEDTHKKDTFWLRLDVLDKLHTLTVGNKGLKTQIINEALELFFKKNKI